MKISEYKYQKFARSPLLEDIVTGKFDMTLASGCTERLRKSTQHMVSNLIWLITNDQKDISTFRYFQSEISENKWILHTYDLLGTLN